MVVETRDRMGSCQPENGVAKPRVDFCDLGAERVRLGYGRRDGNPTEKRQRVRFQPGTGDGRQWHGKQESEESQLDRARGEAHPARDERWLGAIIHRAPREPQKNQRQNGETQRLVKLAVEITR